jgi:hypothetical protein
LAELGTKPYFRCVNREARPLRPTGDHKMSNDFESRHWADRHGDFTAFLSGLAGQIHVAFESLTAHLYESPWDKRNAGSSGCDRNA